MTKRKLAPIIVGLGLAACATAAAIAIPAAVASEKERAEVITYNPSPQLDQWGPPGDRPKPEDQAEWDKFMAEH